MNAATESTHFRLSGDPWLEVRSPDGQEYGAFVEPQGPAIDLSGSLILCRLPVVLGSAPAHDLVSALTGTETAGVLLSRTTEGTLRAQPLGDTLARFNSGPPTRLPHEFETWALVEVAAHRFRVTNAAREASAGRDSDGSARLNRPWGQRASVYWFSRLAVPALIVAAALGSLILSTWLSETGQVDFMQVLIKQRPTLLFGLAWWIAWSAGSKWLSGSARWPVHARLASLAMLAFGGLALVGPVLVAALNPFVPGIYPLSSLAADLGWVLLALCAAMAHVAAIPATRVARGRLRIAICAISLLLAVGTVLEWVSSDRADAGLAPTLPAALSLERALEPVEINAQLQAIKTAADASIAGR